MTSDPTLVETQTLLRSALRDVTEALAESREVAVRRWLLEALVTLTELNRRNEKEPE